MTDPGRLFKTKAFRSILFLDTYYKNIKSNKKFQASKFLKNHKILSKTFSKVDHKNPSFLFVQSIAQF